MITSLCHGCTVTIRANYCGTYYVCNHCNKQCEINEEIYKKEVITFLHKLAKEEGFMGKDILSLGVVLYLCQMQDKGHTTEHAIVGYWSNVGYARTLDNIRYDISGEAYSLFNELHRVFIRLMNKV